MSDPISGFFRASILAGGDPGAEAVGLTVDGSAVSTFNKISIVRQIDAVSTFSVEAPLAWRDPEFRALFRPLAFLPVEITAHGEPVFSGTTMQCRPKLGTTEARVTLEGYGAPGVLGDCSLPEKLLPVMLDGLTLQQAAQRIAAAFLVEVKYDGPTIQLPKTSRDTRIEMTDKALGVLLKLCKPFGLIMSDTPDGKLWIRKSDRPGKTHTDLTEGVRPLVSLDFEDDPQTMFSEVTCFHPSGGKGSSKTPPRVPDPSWAEMFRDEDAPVLSDDAFAADAAGGRPPPHATAPAPRRWKSKPLPVARQLPSGALARGDRVTAPNPHMPSRVIRPLVYQIEDGGHGTQGAAEASAAAKLARMWGNAARWTARVATWRTEGGKVWEPGTLVSVLAPGAFIYRRTYLLIRRAELHRSSTEEHATLDLVLPGAFGGSLPASLPWSV